MFARWVKSCVSDAVCVDVLCLLPVRRCVRESFRLLCAWVGGFIAGSSAVMIPQEYNICCNHVHSDLIWHFCDIF